MRRGDPVGGVAPARCKTPKAAPGPATIIIILVALRVSKIVSQPVAVVFGIARTEILRQIDAKRVIQKERMLLQELEGWEGIVQARRHAKWVSGGRSR